MNFDRDVLKLPSMGFEKVRCRAVFKWHKFLGQVVNEHLKGDLTIKMSNE